MDGVAMFAIEVSTFAMNFPATNMTSVRPLLAAPVHRRQRSSNPGSASPPLSIDWRGRARGSTAGPPNPPWTAREGQVLRAALALLAEQGLAERDARLSNLHLQLAERRREPFHAVLERVRQRGEVTSTTDVELAVNLLPGPAFYRRVVAHYPFPRAHSGAIVDHVLAVITH